MRRERRTWLCVLAGVLAGATGGLLGVWLLRSLGSVFRAAERLLGAETAETLGDIFSATATAHVVPPIGFLLLCSLLLFVVWMAVLHKLHSGARRTVLLACVTTLVVLGCTVGTFALSRVNDVRFVDFLRILLRLLSGGLSDAL